MRMTERSDDGLAQVAARGLAKMGRDITGKPLAGVDRRAADEEDVKYTRRLDRAYGRRRAAEAAAAPEENLENADPEEAAAALATSVFLEMASAKSELEEVMAVLDQSGEVMAVLDQSGEELPPPPAADDGDDGDDDDSLADLVPFGILLLRDANSAWHAIAAEAAAARRTALLAESSGRLRLQRSALAAWREEAAAAAAARAAVREEEEMEVVAASVARPAALAEAVRRLRAHARQCAWSRFDAKVRGRVADTIARMRGPRRAAAALGQWRGFAATRGARRSRGCARGRRR